MYCFSRVYLGHNIQIGGERVGVCLSWYSWSILQLQEGEMVPLIS